MRGRQYPVLVLFVLLTLLRAAAARLIGKVYDEKTQEGIPDLTLKLIPPQRAKVPELTTGTDHTGQFSFKDAVPGKYLLEIYYGLTIVHREVIFLEGELKKSIPLRREHAAQNARESSVPANRPWTDTRIVVQKGEVISFVAAGEIRWGSGADATAGPDGSPKKLRARLGSYPLPDVGAGGLIARVGKARPFKIGTHATIAMPDSGPLYLGINDNFFSGNSGAFHVTITRSSP